jgi:hypothetical protein
MNSFCGSTSLFQQHRSVVKSKALGNFVFVDHLVKVSVVRIAFGKSFSTFGISVESHNYDSSDDVSLVAFFYSHPSTYDIYCISFRTMTSRKCMVILIFIFGKVSEADLLTAYAFRSFSTIVGHLVRRTRFDGSTINSLLGLNGALDGFMPQIGIFAHRRTRQTLIYSRSGKSECPRSL